MQYSEGVDVGYRWYDSQGLTPLFPFGYGLSYTSFSFSNLQVGPLTAGGAATVTATVTNTGTRAGADVAQLYVTDPAASGEPPRQLEGFARVNLQPGASQTGHVPADPAEPAVLELHHQRLGHRDRQLRHLGRRLRREPAADRHAGGRRRPSSASRSRSPARARRKAWPARRSRCR